MHEIRNFSAPNFVLAGKTIDIRAGTPDPPSLDDYRLLSGLRQMPGKVFSAFAAPDDDILIISYTHIEILSPQDFVNRSGHLHTFDKVLACT
jgi:hypothetical protein